VALSQIEIFKEEYQSHYPKAVKALEDDPSLTNLYDFPQPIQRNLYTTNLIECLNKQLKRQTRMKEQFPNESSLERFVCSLFIEWNYNYMNRIHKKFTTAENELLSLLETD
jgi:putative transposase